MSDEATAAARRERAWVLWLAAGVMLWTTLPYILGYQAQGEAWVFTGFVFGVEDGNSYLAKMLSGAEGAWLFRTPYTPYPQSGAAAFLPYLLLGKLTAGPGQHEQLAALYHFFRIAAGFFSFAASYQFISLFLKTFRHRILALLLATLGGGLGWVTLFWKFSGVTPDLPLEYYSPEAFGFLGLFGVPHLAFSRAALLFTLTHYMRAAQRGERDKAGRLDLGAAARMGMWWLAGALFQPLSAVIAGLVIGLHMAGLGVMIAWRSGEARAAARRGLWGALRLAGLAAIIPAPFVLYNVWAFSVDPFLRAWTEQNIITSPPLKDYLWAYGLILPFAALGGVRLLRHKPWLGLLPAAWGLAAPVLAYMPFNLQRRMPEGVWAALVVLAIFAFESGKNPGGRKSKIALGLLAAACLLSTLTIWTGGMLAARQPGLPLFRPADEVRAFQWIHANSFPGEVTLASFETSNALPAWAHGRVLVGHGPESVGAAELWPQVQAFYRAETPDSQRLDWLRRYQVRFILYGPAERKLGAWRPESMAALQRGLQAGEYDVYVFGETAP